MPGALADTVKALRRGELVVYPTDTLYGLGASATDPTAVDRLIDAKRRPAGMPISIALSSSTEIDAWADLGPATRSFARASVPGPVTLLVPTSLSGRRRLAPALLGPDDSIGVRVPDHPIARALAAEVGPITATSANRHGEAPARSLAEARRSLGNAVTAFVDGPPRPAGRPSTLVDLRGRKPILSPRS